MRLCRHASGLLPLATLALAWAAPPPAAPADKGPPGVQIVKGTAIADKIERALPIAAGDLISIRPGVPHWVKAVDGRLRYLTIKVHGRHRELAARPEEGP